ncbi:MAG: DUF3592 domain-containing protein [Candidatus Pacearchaeota archaeon]|jgi:hypothetical protein
MEESRANILIGIIFMVIGIIVLVLGILFLTSNINFVNDSVSVKGKISGADVKFYTPEGKEVRINSGYTEFMARYTDSSEVNLVYNPEKPENAKVSSFSSLWAIPGFIIAIGLIIIFVGLYNMIRI